MEIAGALGPDNLGDGAFFQGNLCTRRQYDIFVTPHSEGYGVDVDFIDSTGARETTELNDFGNNAYAELDWFIQQGGGWTVMCHSIEIMDAAFADLFADPDVRTLFASTTLPGSMLTTDGIRDLPNQGDVGEWYVNDDSGNPGDPDGATSYADMPVAQAVSTIVPQALPGGSGQTGFNTTTDYYTDTEVIAWFMADGQRYDHVIAGSYHAGTGAGKVTYLGGHSFSTNLPYSQNFEAPYLRMFYNTLFFNANGKATFDLITDPLSVPKGITVTVTMTVANVGGSTATSPYSLEVSLEPGVANPQVVYGPNYAFSDWQPDHGHHADLERRRPAVHC